MLANNEIGTVNPINEIGAVVKEKGALFHIDAVQGVGQGAVRRQRRARRPGVAVGAQDVRPEGRRRAVRAAQAARAHHRADRRRRPRARHAFGDAERAGDRRLRQGGRDRRAPRWRARRRACWRCASGCARGSSRRSSTPSSTGRWSTGCPGNLNISFAYVEGEAMLMALKDVAVSSGSACTSASLEPSYVLRALGVDEELAHTSIRFGLGRFNTEEEVDYVTDAGRRQGQEAARAVAALRDGAGGHRSQEHRLGGALRRNRGQQSWRTAKKSSNTTRTRATSGASTRTTRASAPAWSARPRAATS